MKYIVENCPNIRTTITGKKIDFECSSGKGNLCKDVKICPIRRAIDGILVGALNVCAECDNIGYNNGCTEDKCLDYNAMESLRILGVRGLRE